MLKPFRAALLLAAASLLTHAASAAYPDRPIKIIVPFAAGGSTDLVARIYAEKLAKLLKCIVLVDNKPGAGTVVGTDFVAKSAPDGYTLLVATSSHAVNASLYPKLPYDSVTSLTPVSLIAEVPMVIEVNPKVPAQNIDQFLDLLKKNPGKYSFASAGNGSALHMAAELLMLQEKVTATHIPYRGAGPPLSDAMGGQVDFIIDAVSTSAPYVESGNLRALAVTSATRSSVLPKVPTMKEAGHPNYVTTIWNVVMVPAGTPAAAMTQLSQALQQASTHPELQKRLRGLGVEPLHSTAAEAAKRIDSEIEMWGAVVKTANIRPN